VHHEHGNARPIGAVEKLLPRHKVVRREVALQLDAAEDARLLLRPLGVEPAFICQPSGSMHPLMLSQLLKGSMWHALWCPVVVNAIFLQWPAPVDGAWLGERSELEERLAVLAAP